MGQQAKQRHAQVREWLRHKPPLAELRKAYPDEWAVVEREIAELGEHGDAERIRSYVASLSAPPAAAAPRRPAGRDAQLAAEIRQAMAVAALRHSLLRAAAGVDKGSIRFNLLNGFVAQKLLFERDLDRKPVSMLWFRVLWPLLWQRRRLMPLVSPRGIYCFYSKELIRALADMIGGRRCVEIAAGDGTLSRFLVAAGVDVVATDDHSWSHRIAFPREVLRQDARTALRVHRPQVVLCSWPPAGNPFERHVFTTGGVQLYVVIGSRHERGAGDWAAYRRQTEFAMEHDAALSALVLPPELEPAVYVFRRRPTA